MQARFSEVLALHDPLGSRTVTDERREGRSAIRNVPVQATPYSQPAAGGRVTVLIQNRRETEPAISKGDACNMCKLALAGGGGGGGV